jgi:hypothetical protein
MPSAISADPMNATAGQPDSRALGDSERSAVRNVQASGRCPANCAGQPRATVQSRRGLSDRTQA